MRRVVYQTTRYDVDFRIIIPARYDSTRLPGKVLLDIAGKPMLQHVYERSLDSGAESVVIATDDHRVSDVAEKFGAKVCLTSSDHQSGTERIAEAVEALEYDEDEIIVGVQADEPLIPPQAIREVAGNLAEHDNVKVATLCEPIVDVDNLFNPNSVKVILNRRGYAMYFTRSPVPWQQNFDDKAKVDLGSGYYRHVGIYAYRVGFLQHYIEWTDCPLEALERLEQLRILWNGGRIHVGISKHKLPPGVDTEEDLAAIRAQL